MTARRFAGKSVFVTGATSGIGRGIALAFAREGAAVTGAGRNEREGEETRRLIAEEGGIFTFAPMDLADEAAVSAAIASVMARHDRLDCAVNAAGIDRAGPFLDATAADYDVVFGANMRGLFLALREEVAAMRRGGGGAIVNIGSIAGHRAMPGNALYHASKAAAKMLTEAAALDCAAFGVRINEVAPGPVLTPMLKGYFAASEATSHPASAETLAAAMPFHHLLAPADIAAAVLFLCSDAAANVIGASLVVDGGAVLAW